MPLLTTIIHIEFVNCAEVLLDAHQDERCATRIETPSLRCFDQDLAEYFEEMRNSTMKLMITTTTMVYTFSYATFLMY